MNPTGTFGTDIQALIDTLSDIREVITTKPLDKAYTVAMGRIAQIPYQQRERLEARLAALTTLVRSTNKRERAQNAEGVLRRYDDRQDDKTYIN